MDPKDLGVLMMGVIALVIGVGAWALGRYFSRDQIFEGITPGQIGPADGPVGRINGTGLPSTEIAVQYQPPKGVRPGVVGTIIDGKAEGRDVSATIIDLAVRGYLELEEVAPSGKGRKGKPDWLLVRVDKDQTPDDVLAPYESELLAALFVRGPRVTISKLKKSGLSQTLGRTAQRLYEEVVDRGWYRRSPARRRGCLSVLPVVVGVILGGLCFGAAPGVVAALGWAGWIGGGVLVGRAIHGRVPRTALGTAARIQAEGFKKYLATAEADQIKFEDAAGIFSRYLPYAIAFGVADHWTKVFGTIVKEAELRGIAIPNDLDWLDAWIVADLASNALDGLGALADLGDLVDVIGDLSGVFDGIGDIAEGLGDALEGIFDIF